MGAFTEHLRHPKHLTVETGHGRIEWRGIEVREVIPSQMGFPPVAQVARVNRIRELGTGRQEVETIWIITSLTPTQANAARLLVLVRQYWTIENGTQYGLDVSGGEDRCRVRHPVVATVRWCVIFTIRIPAVVDASAMNATTRATIQGMKDSEAGRSEAGFGEGASGRGHQLLNKRAVPKLL
ncbi:MAG: hypothetical protein JNK85_24300 [Verrucomicrobiales bacterium]|nr:hypothetical protein [Verrucomicrobiales bacterium]